MKQIPGFIGILLLAILHPPHSLAQTIKGTVKDSTGHAVPYASINLKSKLYDAIVAYTTTDTGGAYLLRPPNGSIPSDLYVEVRSIGFKDQTRTLTILPSVIDFTLDVSASQLQSVVVQNNRPTLRTHGDTLSYKVTDFSSAQDRVIGDVIKRLPGITVAPDGTISYNNKPISSVYISGDNLLNDKYTIATNSIPQNIVDQVQVIDNHQPVKVLQNKVTSNDVALNLTIKKTGQLHLLGQESIGAGLPGNYDVNLNAMMFKDQYKAINYIKGNNTGVDLQQELVSHNATNDQQRIGYDPPATMLSLGSVNNPALSHQRYLFNHSGILSAHNLVNLKNDWQLRLNSWYLHDQQQQTYSQHSSTYLPGDTVRYTESQHNQFNTNILHTQFTLTLNKEKYYMNDIMLVEDNRWTNYSHLNTNGSSVNQVFRDNLLNLSNEFNWIRSVRSHNLIQTYSYISHLAEPEFRTIGPAYNAALFNDGVPYQQLIQKVNVPTWYTNNYISYKISGNILTKSFITGFSVQSQMLTSNLSIQQFNNTFNPESDSSANNLSWKREKWYAEARLDLSGQKLKAYLSLPLTLQQMNYSDTGYALNKGLTRLYLNPQLIGKYATGAETFVTFQYSYHNETGTIEDIYQGHILKDYRTLYANNPDLTLKQNQQAAVGYYYRKALKLFFFSINIAYNHISANNISSSIITNNLQQRIVLPYPNNNDSWTANGSISKYSFGLHTTFSSSVQWRDNRSAEIQNGALLPFNTTTLTLFLDAATKLNNQLNFSYSVTGTRTDSHSPTETSAVIIYQLLQHATICYNPSTDLQFNLSGEHYLTSRKGNATLEYFFADTWVKYHIKKWRTHLQLNATNILNVKTYNALFLTTNTLTASSYTLPGRIILLKALFNL